MLEILRSDRQNIQGVLFDMDGVVIDSERLFARFWMASAADLGFPMTYEQALQLRSLRREQGIEKMLAFFGPAANFDEIRAHRIELMEAHIAQYGVDEKPGIRPLLALLKEQGIPCAITSSSALAVIRERLGRLGILEDFTALCSGKDVPNGKPAPDIYLHGAASLGLRPEECLALEDAPTGILAAHRAGCVTVMVPDLDQPDEDTQKLLHAKADSLLDVVSLIP
jgi:HAD superfamily hydrolase (TIGR01509 family)